VPAPVDFIVNVDAAVLDCGHEELLGDGADRMFLRCNVVITDLRAFLRRSGSVHG